MEVVRRICAALGKDDAVLKAVPMEKCANRDHLDSALAETEKRGGEGLMLRCPGSKYEHRRSKSLLKVKTFYDEEAIVVGHAGGTGRVAGMCGALLCETPDKRRFKVGSELTQDNIPRFPTLVGERSDMTWAQICAAYVAPGPRKAGAMKKTHTILFDQVLEQVEATDTGLIGKTFCSMFLYYRASCPQP
ncbi:ligA [Symbiodinium pilosum]|uniref:LigA protein n=1 Tax=Symbiodinium pilosum TaxID=2952 RepID=A0A812IUN9_SYMPI|nr:ligA [Symbiodinium pilosum]